ncbi:pyruvate kinase [candidate division KSB1 bacterium]|nr:pyruvate kinase [candidate division KSB1 bacterium]
MRKTKIICTIGPATATDQRITELINNGMNVARLNFSHGDHEQHARMIQKIRLISEQLDQPVGILQDLQGPKIRIGKIAENAVKLIPGFVISITMKPISGTSERISTTYTNLVNDVQPGDTLLLDDGLLKLKALSKTDDEIKCQVIEGGVLSSNKGINLPGIKISEPSLTEKDKIDLKFGIAHDVDFIALSFVRNSNDISKVKALIRDAGKEIPVIAKLEKPEAIADLDAILQTADIAMIARGDLGVEMPLEQVPSIQKRIIQQCQAFGVPVITATQMLESMRENPRPTRAEVSDVANAIYDGTDAVMLSAETATGAYPIEAVQMLSRICEVAEQNYRQCESADILHDYRETLAIADATASSACHAALELNARAIVAFTQSGFTARVISKYHPRTAIIAFTPYIETQRQMSLFYGVNPLRMQVIENTDQVIAQVDRILLEKKLAQKGDVIVITLGAPVYTRGTTNLMKLHQII